MAAKSQVVEEKENPQRGSKLHLTTNKEKKMKKLIIVLSLLLAFSAQSFADEIKYKVTIEVTYNAVSIEKANEVMTDAITKHKTACKTKVKAEKINNYNFVTTNYSYDDNDLVTLTDN